MEYLDPGIVVRQSGENDAKVEYLMAASHDVKLAWTTRFRDLKGIECCADGIEHAAKNPPEQMEILQFIGIQEEYNVGNWEH